MASAVINLTPGAISLISTGKCTENDDLKPVLQVIYINSTEIKKWHLVGLSDGSFKEIGYIAEEIVISNKLQEGSIVQLTKFQLSKFQLTKPLTTSKGEIVSKSYIRVCGLNLLRSKCDIIGAPKYRLNETPLVERTALITRGKDDHANSHHVEEPLTSIQNHKTMAAINLTSGAISKIWTGKSKEDDLKPVLQVTYIDSSRTYKIDNKQWYWAGLSDGSFSQIGRIAEDIFISNKLQLGSIVQLTKFRLSKFQLTKPLTTSNKSVILCSDLIVIHSKCGIIGHPKLLEIETPLVGRATPTIPDKDHANAHHVEEPTISKQKSDHVIDNDDVEEPPTSKQNPSTSAKRCSSDFTTQNKKRNLQSSDDIISGIRKDISTLVSTTVEKKIEDRLGACYKKLETLEEDVSKLTRMAMEKNKEDDVGACFKKLETLVEDVSKITRTVMEINKEVVVGFNKLDISKMKKIQDNDVGACFEKLKILEEDVSKLTRMVMEKNNEDVVGLKKFEIFEENVSKLTRMMMKKNKEDDMGACIEKLDKMGWEAQEPMYDTALLLFSQSADYRKLWLHLKPQSCGNWVKNAGSMFGLLG